MCSIHANMTQDKEIKDESKDQTKKKKHIAKVIVKMAIKNIKSIS